MYYLLFVGSEKLFQPLKDILNAKGRKFISFDTIQSCSTPASSILYHDLYKTECKILASHVTHNIASHFPSNLICSYLPKFESTFKSLCERTTLFPLPYLDSSLLYIELSLRIHSFLVGIKATNLIFSSTPHFPCDFLFSIIAEYLKLDLRIIEPTLISNTCVVRTTTIPEGRYSNFKLNSKPITNTLELFNSESLKNRYSLNYVSSVSSSIPLRSLKVFAISYFFLVRRQFSKAFFSNYIASLFLHPLLSIRLLNRLACLRSTLTTLIPRYGIDNNVKYIIFFLHFQPERTTNPEGGVFDDQIKAIVKLRSLIPANIHLYIKEHPRQLESIPDLRKFSSRSANFYRFISSLPHCSFIQEDSHSLISNSNCLAVSTITGSAGWESLKCGKPVILFGNVWYSSCSSVLNLNTCLDSATQQSLLHHVSLSSDEVAISLRQFELNIMPYLFHGASRDLFMKNFQPSDLLPLFDSLVN